MTTIFQNHHINEDDEYNYKQRHAQGLCPCAGGNGYYIRNQECVNYQSYGYNCVGVRVDPSGQVFSAPWGFDEKEYEVGSDFGKNYAIDHPDEFEGIVLKEKYIPVEIFEYNYDNDYDDSDTASTSSEDDYSDDPNIDGYDSV